MHRKDPPDSSIFLSIIRAKAVACSVLLTCQLTLSTEFLRTHYMYKSIAIYFVCNMYTIFAIKSQLHWPLLLQARTKLVFCCCIFSTFYVENCCALSSHVRKSGGKNAKHRIRMRIHRIIIS